VRSSTAHQNVHGITEVTMRTELAAAGFKVLGLDLCPAAFCTPSPLKDGSLLPVPYMFVRVGEA